MIHSYYLLVFRKKIIVCVPLPRRQGSCPNDAPITSVNQLEEGWEELEYDTYCESKQISFEGLWFH